LAILDLDPWQLLEGKWVRVRMDGFVERDPDKQLVPFFRDMGSDAERWKTRVPKRRHGWFTWRRAEAAAGLQCLQVSRLDTNAGSPTPAWICQSMAQWPVMPAASGLMTETAQPRLRAASGRPAALTALGVLEGLEAQSFSRRGLRLLGGVQQVRTFLDAWIVLVHG
jgi:hypothetical protein